MTTPEAIWAEAQQAARSTPSQTFCGCGFAWINIGGRGKFAKFAKEHLRAHKNYGGRGFNIWYSEVYPARTQNVAEHLEACERAAEVLRASGIDAWAQSRLD